MSLKFCGPCHEHAKKEKHYLNGQEVIVSTPEECSVHPRIDNWRVMRTLKTVHYFGSQPAGFRDRRAPTPITQPGGWVHRRNLEVIVFDYEKPFIDLLVKEGLLEEVDVERHLTHVLPRSVRLTAKGDLALGEHIRKGANPDTMALAAPGGA